MFPYRPHLKVFLIANSPKQLAADCNALCLKNHMLPIVTFSVSYESHVDFKYTHSKKVKEKKEKGKG